MGSVRLLLTLAIAVHLSGIPAVAASPCAMVGESGHGCCMRHPAETRGPAIGHCGCPAPAQPSDSVSAVSTAAGSAEKASAPMTPAVGLAGFVPLASHLFADAGPSGPHPSPPPLTAVGLRC